MYLNKNGKILVGAVSFLIGVLALVGLVWLGVKYFPASAQTEAPVENPLEVETPPQTHKIKSVELKNPSWSQLWTSTRSLVESDPILLEECKNMASNLTTRVSYDSNKLLKAPGNKPKPKATVVAKDAVSVALEQANQGKRVLLVNFANNRRAGNGYDCSEGNGQELDIFRRTTLPFALDYSLKVQPSSVLYPINMEKHDSNGILTKGVRIIWEKRPGDLYATVEVPPKIDVLSVPAYRNESKHDAGLFRGGYFSSFGFTQEGRTLARKRIALQIQVAKSLGVDVLVTGAFGCGNCGNKPDEVAEIFKEVFDDMMDGCSFNIVFAIPESSPEYAIFRDFGF